MDLGKYHITADDAYMIVVDVQERMAPATDNYEYYVERIERMAEAAALLSFKVGCTEQYPKGLGPTVEPLKSKLEAAGASFFDKTAFNACTYGIMQDLKKLGRGSVIVTGMETHICVYQTVRQLLAAGYKVFVPCDCVTSRSPENRENALEQFRSMGAVVTNSETLLFDMLGDSRSASFKAISNLVK